MARCKQEMCPMWDGDTCPCATFGLDPDNLPTEGTFDAWRPVPRDGRPDESEAGR